LEGRSDYQSAHHSCKVGRRDQKNWFEFGVKLTLGEWIRSLKRPTQEIVANVD